MQKFTKAIAVIMLLITAFVMLYSCNKPSSDKRILSFKFYEPAVQATIMESAKTVIATVPAGTNVTALVPVITVSDNATIYPASGVPQDFTYPKTYIVTAEDGTQARYTVTIVLGNGGNNGGDDGSENIQTFSIVVSANPNNGGMVMGEGNYEEGQTCTVTATPDTDFIFSNWVENDDTVCFSPNYTFTVSRDRYLVACFTNNIQPTCTITLMANPTNGGSVSGGGTCIQGQSCTVSATANSGYSFTNWTENSIEVSTNSSYTFSVSNDRSLVANFTHNIIGGYEYVDLGLPSGTLWATCNVNAISPASYGSFVAWGETQLKNSFSWSNYKYCIGDERRLTKYCYDSSYGNNGNTDNLTVLEPSDDLVTTSWGSDWHTPTREDWAELLAHTRSVWGTQNGIWGRTYIGTNGNKIFLPAVGRVNESSWVEYNQYGFYWTSTLHSEYPHHANIVFIYQYGSTMSSEVRFEGIPVRAVHPALKK